VRADSGCVFEVAEEAGPGFSVIRNNV